MLCNSHGFSNSLLFLLSLHFFMEAAIGLLSLQPNPFLYIYMYEFLYSLVGYAANGWFRMPHSHTMQNEIFNSPLKFEQALSNFRIIDASDIEDPLNAIEFAAKQPFRTGVSKTIVLIPCDECKEQASTYLDIQQLLLNRDIRLHVLRQENFELKKDTPTSSYIFRYVSLLT